MEGSGGRSSGVFMEFARLNNEPKRCEDEWWRRELTRKKVPEVQRTDKVVYPVPQHQGCEDV